MVAYGVCVLFSPFPCLLLAALHAPVSQDSQARQCIAGWLDGCSSTEAGGTCWNCLVEKL